MILQKIRINYLSVPLNNIPFTVCKIFIKCVFNVLKHEHKIPHVMSKLLNIKNMNLFYCKIESLPIEINNLMKLEYIFFVIMNH